MIVDCKPLVAYVDRPSQAFGGRWSRLKAFGGIRGSSIMSLWWQMESFTSLWWHTWIVVYKVFAGVRGISYPSRRWLTWIAVHKPLVADGLVYKPLVACVDRCLQAFDGKWSHLQAFGGIRGSSFTSLWWQMESFTSLWWHTWIVDHKPLVADGVINKPLVAYVDHHVQGFFWRVLIVV